MKIGRDAVTRMATGLASGAGAIAAVSLVVAVLKDEFSAIALTSLYLLAIFPVAIRWGFWPAAVVAIASFLAFDFLFTAPEHTFRIASRDTTATLVVSIASAFVVSELARRARDSRREARLRAQEAALRRVAILVAQDAGPDTVFGAVAEEVAGLLSADGAVVQRFSSETETTVVGTSGTMTERFPVGTRLPLEAGAVTALVHRTRRPARSDDYEHASGPRGPDPRTAGMRSAVGAPIFVAGRLWGAIVAGSWHARPLAADAELRLTEFTELIATAISNLQAQAIVERLAEEQAALRRVATMIARDSPAEEVFARVAEDVGRLLRADAAAVWRYQPGDRAFILGSWGSLDPPPVVRPQRLDGDSVVALVYRTGRPARFDAYESTTGDVAEYVRKSGIRSAVGTPIVVGGRLWGSIGVATISAQPIAADAEARMAEFTELVAIAISNLQARADLTASRARLATAADQERRRVVRDLHDGAQQRLVHTIVTLKLAQRALDEHDAEARALVDEALAQAEQSNSELRDLAHGILPAALTTGGLQSAIATVIRRVGLPVEVVLPSERFAPDIEATAYFIIAEALTNVVKHAYAGAATVTVDTRDGMLHVEVGDDGVGGADPRGHGLVGISDRVAALGGRFEIDSERGAGTRVTAALPLATGGRRTGGDPP
jgi:signal transduction histidine kinase